MPLKRLPLCSAILAFALGLPACFGQDPVPADPKHYTLDTDNEQVRVLRIRLGPREQSAPYAHSGQLLVFTTGTNVAYRSSGNSVQILGRPGETRWLGPSTGSFENTSGRKADFLCVQLKQPGLPLSDQSTVATLNTAGSPRYDLTGMWYRSSADTPNDQGELEFRITRVGDSMVGTKTTSSIYIPAGQVVLQGTLISDSTIEGKVQRAYEGYVSPYWVDAIIG